MQDGEYATMQAYHYDRLFTTNHECMNTNSTECQHQCRWNHDRLFIPMQDRLFTTDHEYQCTSMQDSLFTTDHECITKHRCQCKIAYSPLTMNTNKTVSRCVRAPF